MKVELQVQLIAPSRQRLGKVIDFTIVRNNININAQIIRFGYGHYLFFTSFGRGNGSRCQRVMG